MFEVQDFTNVILFVWNRPEEDFIDMYKSIGLSGESYIKEKWNKARQCFASWWCDLDGKTKINIINYTKNFYGRK